MSRQIVGHVRVNEKPVNIPSYLVKTGDLIQLTDAARETPVIKEELGTRPLTASWLERDDTAGRVTGMPQRNDIDADIRRDLIVESYAR
jgi:small subunit ribosomal protein S4